eukprot:6891405-Prymnesium_polylepis.1
MRHTCTMRQTTYAQRHGAKGCGKARNMNRDSLAPARRHSTAPRHAPRPTARAARLLKRLR